MTPSSVMGVISDYAHADSPFSDIKVRQAVSYAIDNKTVAKTVGYGYYEAANQFTGPRTWYYNPTVIGYPYNPDKAKQLLAEAGYPKGFQTSITYQSTTAYQDLFTTVQGYLSKVSIDAKLEPVSVGVLTETRAKGWNNKLVLFDVSYAIGFDPATPLTSRLSSKGTRYDLKSINIPADYDAELFQAAVERDTGKRAAMYQNLMKMIIDKYFMAVPIYIGNSLVAYSSTVHDLGMNESASHVWFPENIWLSK